MFAIATSKLSLVRGSSAYIVQAQDRSFTPPPKNGTEKTLYPSNIKSVGTRDKLGVFLDAPHFLDARGSPMNSSRWAFDESCEGLFGIERGGRTGR